MSFGTGEPIMPPESSPHVATVALSSNLPHEALHYSLRRLEHGEWAVERADGDVGGIFVTLGAAICFLRSELEKTMVIPDVKRAA
jgi:hypothetical protein